MGTHLGGLWQKRRSSMTYATQRSLGLDPFQMQLPMNVQADMANRVGFQQQQSSGGAGGAILIGGVLLVAAGVAIYFAVNHAKEERVLRARIVEKDGAAGLAQYEDAKTKRAAVQGGLGILSGLAWGGDNRRMRRNKKRARKTSRH